MKQCLEDLQSTNPCDDKDRIAANKGTLLRDSYEWILHNSLFQSWLSGDETQILWIKGAAGKGKTMIMMGLEKELSARVKSTGGILTYFFCQNTDEKLNHAVAIVKGLIFLLAMKMERLVKHLQVEVNPAWKDASRGVNAFYALWRVLSNMVNDLVNSSSVPVFLMIDALDECDAGSLKDLLRIITKESPGSPSTVKWLLASRYDSNIVVDLQHQQSRLKILELNQSPMANAVHAYIDSKVGSLSRNRGYDRELRDTVKAHLLANSEGTFLWVALVCEELEGTELWETKQMLYEFPSGLNPLYDRMTSQIQKHKPETQRFCLTTLSVLALASRPLKLCELPAIAGLPEQEFEHRQALEGLVKICGSFLTLRDDTVFFVHQSAKDYIIDDTRSNVFVTGQSEHRNIALRSLRAMSVLKKNICGIATCGPLLDKDKTSQNLRPLEPIRYACCYWVDHFSVNTTPDQAEPVLVDDGEVHRFLEQHLLHWIESLSLLGRISDGILMIRKLFDLVQVCCAP
jgi:hypothetical protein